MFGASRAQLEYRPLPSIEIVNHDVDVHLLRNGLPWPLWWAVLLDALEADALVAGGVAHLAPPVVRARSPVEQGAVELCQAAWVVTVEYEGGETSDWHRLNVCPFADRTGPESMAGQDAGNARASPQPADDPERQAIADEMTLIRSAPSHDSRTARG